MSAKPLSPKHRSTFFPLQHPATPTFSVDWGLASGALWDDVINPQDADGNSLRQPLQRPSCWPDRTCLFCGYGTGAPMSVRAVTSRLWNRSLMDCCRRMLTSSTALGEMSTSIHRWSRFAATTHGIAQRQAEEGQPKGAGSENRPPLLSNESAESG